MERIENSNIGESNDIRHDKILLRSTFVLIKILKQELIW